MWIERLGESLKKRTTNPLPMGNSRTLPPLQAMMGVVNNFIVQLCPTLCNSMYYSLPGSSVHGILQARVLEWVAIPSSRVSSFTCLFTSLTLWTLSSVQFSHSVLSHSLQPHESQHTSPPCPSPTPRVHSNPCPSSW